MTFFIGSKDTPWERGGGEIIQNNFSPEKLYDQGLKLLAYGKIRSACESFCRLLSACPDALDDIAAAFRAPAERKQALDDLRTIMASGPSGSTYWALAARLGRDTDSLNEACQWARRAVKADPSCATWWFELGEIHMALGNTREAADAYQRCLSINSNHIPACNALAICKQTRWTWLARLLIRSPQVCRLLQQLALGNRRVKVLENREQSAAVHQMRWIRALEYGSTMWVFPAAPEGMEPENFSEHWENCPCIIWHWFLGLGIDKEIQRVLDVGCGEGYLTEHFVRQGYDVTGVTCSPYEKTECLKRGIKVLEDDFHFLSVADNTFDLIFSSQSLEHSISPLFALYEWKRVVRPGGYLIIILPLPIEQDIRAHFADSYNPETDSVDFCTMGRKTLTSEEMRSAFFAYGSHGHVFVLTYWQLRWLFHLMNLELVVSLGEDPVACKLLGIEHIDGSLKPDPMKTLNGVFLLRKPEK